MKVAAHLASFHGKAASRHADLAKCFGKLAGLSKAAKSDLKDEDADGLCSTLQKIADSHTEASAFHKDMLAECFKAEGDDDLNKGASDLIKRLEHLENTIVPSKVSGVVPNAPRSVPRFGAPPLQRPEVPVNFAHLSQIEEE